MSNINSPNRPGQFNQAGRIDANTLVQFTGEILSTYQAETKLEKFGQTRTITNGRSTTFTGIGTATSRFYGVAGTTVDTGQDTNPPVATKTVNVDAMCVSTAFLGDLDESIINFDIRAPLARELGTALAIAADRRRLRTMVRGARARAHWLDQRDPGNSFVRGTTVGTAASNSLNAAAAGYNGELRVGSSATNAAETIAQLYTAARILTEKNCPMSERFAIVRPSTFYALLTSPQTIFSSDFSGGSGGFNAVQARVPMVADMEIVMLQPQIFDTGNAGETETETRGGNDLGNSGLGVSSARVAHDTRTNNYRIDLLATRFLAGHKSALANVKLRNLEMQNEYSVRNQGTLFVARYAMGHDVLRQEFLLESGFTTGTGSARGNAASGAATAGVVVGAASELVQDSGNNN